MPYLTDQRHAADLVETSTNLGFAEIALPGEPTDHEALVIAPHVDTVLRRDHTLPGHQTRYTGGFMIVNRHSGVRFHGRFGMPLEWLRRFARLLATSGIDWEQVTGDPCHVTHPQHMVVRSLGDHVLRCWLTGVPVGPGRRPSLHTDCAGFTTMQCCNRHCEDDGAGDLPAVLCDGEGDEARLPASEDLSELKYLAGITGWSQLTEHGYWLCDTCTHGHQPAVEPIAGRIRHCLDIE